MRHSLVAISSMGARKFLTIFEPPSSEPIICKIKCLNLPITFFKKYCNFSYNSSHSLLNDFI